MLPERQTLIFDADDTLWENNVFFERALEDFMDWVAHPTLDRIQIRAIFTELEAANVVAHGYGSRVFLRTLAECFDRLSGRPTTEQERREIDELAAAVVEQRVELVPEVAATLRALGSRHDLHLLTKGVVSEQQRKIDASGLAPHFQTVRIVAEKNTEVYKTLVTELELRPQWTWMIGNSPRSDILPARRAGLNAVFIPNANTWAHEQEELDPHDNGVLELASFADLVTHF